MSRVTDVLVSFDTETILKKYPNPSRNPDQPTLIDWQHVYMITNQDNVVSGQAGGELDLKAQVGDLIRWRETSLSLGFEKSVIFYRFIGNVGANLISTPDATQGDRLVRPAQHQQPGHSDLPESRQLLLVVRDTGDRSRDLSLQFHDRGPRLQTLRLLLLGSVHHHP